MGDLVICNGSYRILRLHVLVNWTVHLLGSVIVSGLTTGWMLTTCAFSVREWLMVSKLEIAQYVVYMNCYHKVDFSLHC